MTILYAAIAALLWYLMGWLCGMCSLAIDSHVQTQHRFMRYDIREVVGANLPLFSLISLFGPVLWGALLFAAWRKWV